MAKIDQVLAQVESLVEKVRPQEAQDRLLSLVGTMGDEELKVWEADLRATIDHFLPKRRKELLRELDDRLHVSTDAAEGHLRFGPTPRQPEVDVSALRVQFESTLRELSDHHIYQWSTFYRDRLSTYFEKFLSASMQESNREVALKAIRESLALHSHEIFGKGFRYQVAQVRESTTYAVAKSQNGLQRFLDLPIEFFSTRNAAGRSESRALRQVCSAMLAGILEGYGEEHFGDQSGWQLLSRNPKPWAHNLAFSTDADLSRLMGAMEAGEFRDGIARSVRPLIQALDDLSSNLGDYVPLVALAQFNWEARRLDVSIRPPPYPADPQLIEIQCFLDSGAATRRDFEEASRRAVAVVVAPLRPDLQALINTSEKFKAIAVPARSDEGPGGGSVRKHILSNLEHAIYSRRSPRLGAQPLQHNFARLFPLQNQFLTRYVHVYRSSVRELLRAFEQRNGVRLWCSIRRSGKTTACLDLASTTGRSVVVLQTCETTGQIPDGSVFYDSVCEALARGSQVSSTFFVELVERSASERNSIEDRIVFVLDEYETLFGRLNAAVSRDPDLRYTVAQPLLNQMVAFSRENLLVLIGQQPNAHYILMDQNQLSPYVQQDSFPLFQHEAGTAHGELSELIRKVLTERVSIDASFVDGVYAETAGHPYLTVSLLVEFVEWLIEKKRPVSSLQLDGDDLDKFTRQRLRPKDVSLSPEYRFFREAISEALGSDARKMTPWLHAIYSCVRDVARSSPTSSRCSRSDFERLVERARLPELGMDPDLLLETGSQANFLEYDEDYVWAKIRLLGRLAAVTRGRVSA